MILSWSQPGQANAYHALAVLSHALADYGLTLNRTKTTFLSSKHFCDYAQAQLRGGGEEANKLREIDLKFDPYSDRAEEDYEELKETVQSLEVRTLLDLELNKGQPDVFLVAQIGRTLKLHSPGLPFSYAAHYSRPRISTPFARPGPQSCEAYMRCVRTTISLKSRRHR